MRLLGFIFVVLMLFSCKRNDFVDDIPNFEKELIGFGFAGPYPDSLIGSWEFSPWTFDEWHSSNLFSDQYNTTFSQDTMCLYNFNLQYSERVAYENSFLDTAKSRYLISQQNDLFRFDKIEGRKEMPDRFFVKMYPNTVPDGFQYFYFSGFDLSYRTEFQVDSNMNIQLIVQQRDNGTTSKVDRLSWRRNWSSDERVYINTFLHAFCSRRLDTVHVNWTNCDGSELATLVYNDSVYHYSWPIFNFQLYYLRSVLISRLQWYHYTGESLPRPYLKREYFYGFPVVLEMEGPPSPD